MKQLEETFKRNFHKASGAKIEGVALGIAGDTAPNVLWRLLHGELPDYFSPKVWWLSLGNNDLGRMEVRTKAESIMCVERSFLLSLTTVTNPLMHYHTTVFGGGCCNWSPTRSRGDSRKAPECTDRNQLTISNDGGPWWAVSFY